MNLNNIGERALKEVFDALEEAFASVGADYYLIGALARDYWFSRAKKSFRETRDVDFAVLVGSKEDYEAVRQFLKDHKSFRETKANSFVLLTPDGIEVDILPFGGIEIDEGVHFEGAGLTSIQVNGFKEVYAGGTDLITAETGHVFEVATLPAIVLLKLISYDDRPEKRGKDARDIANILLHYFHLESDFVYEYHNDLFGKEQDPKLEEIGAEVVGREIKRICGTNQDLFNRVNRVVSEHIKKEEENSFVKNMVAETGGSVEESVALLTALRRSWLS